MMGMMSIAVSSGAEAAEAKTGWQKNGSSWYYYDENGTMQTGWQQIKNERYYFDENGRMAVGDQVIDGMLCHFRWDGVLLTTEAWNSSWVNYDPAPGMSFARTHTAHDIELGLPRDKCEFGWQCAEFLSNCIGKGGMKEYDDHATALHNKLAQNSQIQEVTIKLDNGYIMLENVPAGYEIAAGDPILLYCPNEKDGKPFVHSLFFMGWDEKGYAKIYCHNNRNAGGVNRWPACYACHGRLTEAHCMHIKGNDPAKNGTYPANTWMTVAGETFYIGSNGVRETGWTRIDGAWYYLDRRGVPVKDWQRIDGRWYRFSSDNGVMLTGWWQFDDQWYYLNKGGSMQTGWKKIDGHWYYFANSGVMQTGRKQIDGKWYIFSKGGVMQTGWREMDGEWYYYGANGAMSVGWKKINGKWYYFNEDGTMQTFWATINDKKYFFGDNGVMQTRWKMLSRKWYYFGTGGFMITGWKHIGGNWYYFTDKGMVTGLQVIDGKTYRFNKEGAYVEEVKPESGTEEEQTGSETGEDTVQGTLGDTTGAQGTGSETAGDEV